MVFRDMEGGISVMASYEKKEGRFAIADREAFYSIILAALNFVWWYLMAYRLGDGSVEDYTYVMGFPSWFFYSCIVGFVLFAFFATAMVHFLFREVPLDSEER